MALSKEYKTRSWAGTIPAERFNKEQVEEALKGYTYVGQLELGEGESDLNPTGYLHWQMYIENKSQIRLGTLINRLPGSHWEPRHGTKKQLFDYCTKEETYQGVSISNGEIDLTEPEQGARNDLRDLKNEILFKNKTASEVILDSPTGWLHAPKLREVERSRRDVKTDWAKKNYRKVQVSYVWGRTGTGKTHDVYEEHGLENVFSVGDWKHPFDNYEGEDVLLLDEFYSSMKFENLLKLTDKYPYQLEARFGKRQAAFTKVVLTSNEPLSMQYLDEQRFKPLKWDAFMRRITDVKEKISWTESIDETHLYKPTDKGERNDENEERIEEEKNIDISGFSTCDILHGTYCACGAA